MKQHGRQLPRLFLLFLSLLFCHALEPVPHDARRPCDNGQPAWAMTGQSQLRDSRLPFPGSNFPVQEKAKLRPLGSQILGTPLIAQGGRVILHTDIGYLYVIRSGLASVERIINTGAQTAECFLLVPYMPEVVACYNSTSLATYSLANGSLLWQVTNTRYDMKIVSAMPLRDQGPKLIVLRGPNNLQILSAVDGQVLVSRQSYTGCASWAAPTFRQSPVTATLYMGYCRLNPADLTFVGPAPPNMASYIVSFFNDTAFYIAGADGTGIYDTETGKMQFLPIVPAMTVVAAFPKAVWFNFSPSGTGAGPQLFTLDQHGTPAAIVDLAVDFGLANGVTTLFTDAEEKIYFSNYDKLCMVNTRSTTLAPQCTKTGYFYPERTVADGCSIYLVSGASNMRPDTIRHFS